MKLKTKKLTKKCRNTTLNFFELLGVCCVCLIHLGFPTAIGTAINTVGRFAVPLFFTVSGFYLLKEDITKEALRIKLKNRILKLIKLLSISIIIYVILGILQAQFGSNPIGISNWFKETFAWKQIIKFIFLNACEIGSINWFMFALIYCYILIYSFANITINSKFIPYIFAILAIIRIPLEIVLTATNANLFGVDLSYHWLYRNWFFFGMPFISLGIILKRKEHLLTNMNFKIIIALFVVGAILSPIEYLYMNRQFNHGFELYCGSIILVFAIMCLSIKKPNLFSNSKLISYSSNYTMFIYIYHKAVIIVLLMIFNRIGIDGNVVIKIVRPILVIVISYILAIISYKFLFFIHSKLNKDIIV